MARGQRPQRRSPQYVGFLSRGGDVSNPTVQFEYREIRDTITIEKEVTKESSYLDFVSALMSHTRAYTTSGAPANEFPRKVPHSWQPLETRNHPQLGNLLTVHRQRTLQQLHQLDLRGCGHHSRQPEDSSMDPKSSDKYGIVS